MGNRQLGSGLHPTGRRRFGGRTSQVGRALKSRFSEEGGGCWAGACICRCCSSVRASDFSAPCCHLAAADPFLLSCPSRIACALAGAGGASLTWMARWPAAVAMGAGAADVWTMRRHAVIVRAPGLQMVLRGGAAETECMAGTAAASGGSQLNVGGGRRPKRRLEAKEGGRGAVGVEAIKQSPFLAKKGTGDLDSGHVLDGVPQQDWPSHVEMLRLRKEELKGAFRRTRSREDARALLVAQDTYARARRILSSAAAAVVQRAENRSAYDHRKDTEHHHQVWKAGVREYFASWDSPAREEGAMKPKEQQQQQQRSQNGERHAGRSKNMNEGGGADMEGASVTKHVQPRGAKAGEDDEAGQLGRRAAREAAGLALLHQAFPESELWEPDVLAAASLEGEGEGVRDGAVEAYGDDGGDVSETTWQRWTRPPATMRNAGEQESELAGQPAATTTTTADSLACPRTAPQPGKRARSRADDVTRHLVWLSSHPARKDPGLARRRFHEAHTAPRPANILCTTISSISVVLSSPQHSDPRAASVRASPPCSLLPAACWHGLLVGGRRPQQARSISCCIRRNKG